MATDLPTNIDATYADRSPGDTAHQQYHDTVHGVVNEVSAELEGRLSEAGLNAAMGEQASDPETPLGGALSATIDGRVTPSAITGTSPLRANRLHLGRARALTQGTNYNAFPGLAVLPSGRIVVAYRSASGHVTTDGAIVARYSDDGGATWTAPATAVANAAGSDKRDASLSLTSLGLTLTYFSWDGVRAIGVHYVTSQDSGATWSAPATLPPVHEFWDAVTAPMIELANGDLLVPCYGRDGDAGAPGPEEVFSLISTDQGGSWTPYTIAAAGGTNYEEPFVQQLSDGTLLALIRIPGSGYAHKATSTDSGRTWSAVSQAFTAGDGRNAFTETSDGTLVVFTEATTAVTRPVVRASYDKGATWTEAQVMAYSAGGGAYAQAGEVTPGVLAVIQGYDGHSSKTDVGFRYVTVGPRVTPLGDGAGLRVPSALVAHPTGLLAYDTFDRANEATLNYSLSDSGHQWRIISGTPVLTDRTVRANSNGNVCRVVIEAGTADVEMGMAWRWETSTNLQAVFRAVDNSNFLHVQNVSEGTWKLSKAAAGVETDLVTVSTGVNTPVNCWYRVRVVAKGKRVRVFLDDEKIIDHTLSAGDVTAYASNTLHGFQVRHTAHQVKNFWLAQ